MTQSGTSTELTGGTGFTYEDTVVAYYLAALLREDRAAPFNKIVRTVAIQQAGHGHPMDDIIIEFGESSSNETLALQVKRKITISAAQSNTDFRDVLSRAVATRSTQSFKDGIDAYGFVTEHIAVDSLRGLQRLIDWAKSSPDGAHFAAYFSAEGSAAEYERKLREELNPLLGVDSDEAERKFYAQFYAAKLDGLAEAGAQRTDIINRLQELIATNLDGQDILLFDRLCRIARDGSGNARKWNRQTLLTQLRGTVRLKVVPNYQHDIDIIQAFSKAGMADISDDIDGFRVDRPLVEQAIRERLLQSRLVNISGLPGCGKSAMLKRLATHDAESGPILFIKSDRLEGKSWLSFANTLGLQHHGVADLLAEIGSTGTAILFIDGIDRVPLAQRGLILDVLRAIEKNEQLSNWTVLATSRDQGLETYRTWFPPSFYGQGRIGDVSVSAFSDEEAELLGKEKPNLSRLLFGAPAIMEIARRPFFAAVLAQNFPDNAATPQTEVDLIATWWNLAGHNTPEEEVPQRQRAILDLAENGARNLGKNILTRSLKEATVGQIAALKADLLIRTQDGGASYSFTHDIFFEWGFFRYLIDLGNSWITGLVKAGEPPLLGRVIGLLAQSALSTSGKWSAGYRDLAEKPLRSQWRREWLTSAPFTPAFAQAKQEFQALLTKNDYALFEKVLVWFQAQHTIPSPVVLQNLGFEDADRVAVAELLGWPSDFLSWGRFLDWLTPLAPSLPPKLLPNIVEVFGVWQNACGDFDNPRSAAMIEVCNNWLIELEGVEYSEGFNFKHGRWDALGSEARSAFATALRVFILRSARAYPATAIALFDRAVANKRMRSKAYGDLVNFTSIMAEISPASVIAVAKAELMEELPDDKAAREEREHQERLAYLEELTAIPERDRTDQQKEALNLSFFPLSYGRGTRDLENFGIDRHHSYYYPTSALHEPFASLFAKKPEAALSLVRDLANHATTAWRQTRLMNRQQAGTPVPITVRFPWGDQTFWGNWNVYGWFVGWFAPQPLECAFLALSHWAFKQIESRKLPDEIIRSVVEGNTCYAALGLASTLALETYHVSEVTLPIVACQRLWEHDLARCVQEPTRDMDLFGMGIVFPRLAGKKAEAKAFLNSRESRKRSLRDLAVRFAITSQPELQERFKAALAAFPADLPFEVEEQRSIPSVVAELKENAERLAGLGDIKNYRKQKAGPDTVAISYHPPVPLTPEQEDRLVKNTASLQEMSVFAWASKSLHANKLVEGIKLEDAVAFAKQRDDLNLFDFRREVGEHSSQTVVSAVAALFIRFGSKSDSDYGWAWEVMGRVFQMKEPTNEFAGSKIPWHPANHLIVALHHDRQSGSPLDDTASRLLQLTLHPIEDVGQMAFSALLRGPDDNIQWIAAQLAVDLAIYHQVKFLKGGRRDDSSNQRARAESLNRALERLGKVANNPLTDLPPPWVQVNIQRKARVTEEWRDGDPAFDPHFAGKIFPQFPIESWCQSTVRKPLAEQFLKQLVTWTAERLMPSWYDKKKGRTDLENHRTNLIEWNHVLGDLLARAVPFFDIEIVRKTFLAPFINDNEQGLGVLAAYVNMTVARHIFDAATIPSNTLAILGDSIERVIKDPMFKPNSYRAGQVHGFDMPKLIEALLLKFESEAPGSSRFANGDWSQIALVIPLITRLVTAIGWSAFVMQRFLMLCERAGTSYPIDAFAQQTNAVLSSIANAKGSWAGTTLPAKIAAMVQRLADANSPLQVAQAKELLRVLDALIDLGDRRSAALEQTEAFRKIQD